MNTMQSGSNGNGRNGNIQMTPFAEKEEPLLDTILKDFRRNDTTTKEGKVITAGVIRTFIIMADMGVRHSIFTTAEIRKEYERVLLLWKNHCHATRINPRTKKRANGEDTRIPTLDDLNSHIRILLKSRVIGLHKENEKILSYRPITAGRELFTALTANGPFPIFDPDFEQNWQKEFLIRILREKPGSTLYDLEDINWLMMSQTAAGRTLRNNPKEFTRKKIKVNQNVDKTSQVYAWTTTVKIPPVEDKTVSDLATMEITKPALVAAGDLKPAVNQTPTIPTRVAPVQVAKTTLVTMVAPAPVEQPKEAPMKAPRIDNNTIPTKTLDKKILDLLTSENQVAIEAVAAFVGMTSTDFYQTKCWPIMQAQIQETFNDIVTKANAVRLKKLEQMKAFKAAALQEM